MTRTQFENLKAEVDDAKAAAARAEGAYEEAMDRLATEFGISTLAEAREKLKQDEKIAAEAEEDFDKALKEYQKKWKE